SFTEAMTGTAVGYTGTILRTTDGGCSWTPQTSGTTSWLRGVWFTDAITGTAVGQSGTILRTTDGGTTWVPQTSGTTGHLIGVYLTDAMTGTCVGNRGTILNTTDGGDTWVPQPSGTQVQLRNVWFADVTTGTVVGEAGTILRTVDGGGSWSPQTSVATSWLGDVSFTDAATGITVGAGGVILRTTDGEDTWNCEASGVTNEINGVLYIDDETAVAVGDQGVILRWEEDIFTPVLITAFYAKPVEDGIELNWSLFADERVNGFRIYRSGRDETTDRLLNTQRLAGTSRRYVDLTALPGERYRYTLAVLASESGEIRSAPVMAERPALATQLFQNRPNPFNPNTSIRYTISRASLVSLRVYSTSGELIRTLVDQRVPSGLQEAMWDGTNDAGSPVASGVYVYRLRAGNVTRSKKMVLLK
ncbi:MAG: T9SS type A sorting domain-containing protein, partial [Candidatus Krumholzibacteria bacterium]|nr:T9SS type A sorting domain-containing protein [Candidatus Krumholzibacteria bacterium]